MILVRLWLSMLQVVHILAFLFPHSGCILVLVIMHAAVCKIKVHIHECDHACSCV